MSRIGAIRTALAAVIAEAEGIKQVSPYPPEKVAANGTAWIGFFDDAVTFSQRELHLYMVPVTVIVNRNARLPAALAETEPVIDALLAELRTNMSLGIATVSRVQVTRIQQGIWEVGGVDYVGFQISLAIKESFGASYS